MLSFLLPHNVNIFVSPGYVKRVGPAGFCIKKTGPLSFNVVSTSEGSRLFISSPSLFENKAPSKNFIKSATALSYLFRLALGLSRGFRRRLRLVGIGFRAVRRETNSAFPIHTKNYRRKRRQFQVAKEQLLTLKIGYSHESSYPLSTLKNRVIKTSRLEGRSKGTLISLQSNNLEQVNQVAAEIRSFRLPDIYKGKGIYLDREVIKLKKGKRQG